MRIEVTSRDTLPIGSSLPYLGTTHYFFFSDEDLENGEVVKSAHLSYIKSGESSDTLMMTWPNRLERSIVLAQSDEWFVNWADIPKVEGFIQDRASRLAPNPQTHLSHELTKSDGGTYDYNVETRSVNIGDGKYYSRPSQRLHDHPGPGEHGFVSYAAEQDSMHLFWLDGRASSTGGSDHGHSHGDAMQLRTRTVSRDGGMGKDQLIDKRVCDCCPTNAVMTSNGPLVVYRDRSDAEVRDIYRALPATELPPAAVHHDGWKIAGCPVNGPALAASSTGDTVAVAWYTETADKPTLKIAWSIDGGVNFSLPTKLTVDNPLGRVDMTWLRDGVILTYLGETSKSNKSALHLNYWTINEGLSCTKMVDSLSSTRSSGIPRVKVEPSDETIWVAYTQVIHDTTNRIKLAQLQLNFSLLEK